MHFSVGYTDPHQSVIGTELATQINFGSDISHEKISEARRQLEQFEIGYGQQMDSIIRYSDNRRRISTKQYNNAVNHSDNNLHIKNDNTNNNMNDNMNTNNNMNDNMNNHINYNNSGNGNNIEWQQLGDMYGIYINEPFYGSQIISRAEKILTIKSVLIALLFIIISRPFFINISKLANLKLSYISPIVIRAIIFGLCFYVIEKYLLK